MRKMLLFNGVWHAKITVRIVVSSFLVILFCRDSIITLGIQEHYYFCAKK